MKFINYATVKYLLYNCYVLVTDSNKVRVIIVKPILNVRKCNIKNRVILIITNQTGIDLKNICIFGSKKVLIEKLKNNSTTIVDCLPSCNNCFIIKYRILINNVNNIFYLIVK